MYRKEQRAFVHVTLWPIILCLDKYKNFHYVFDGSYDYLSVIEILLHDMLLAIRSVINL
jgi:hypothetical protein